MILGMYYLTCINETKGDPNKLKRFYSIEEIIAAKNAEKWIYKNVFYYI